MELPTLAEIEAAARNLAEVVPSTLCHSWPLLNERLGFELWVKHENHTAIGSFKIRGALHYVSRLLERSGRVPGVIAATRGNYGQAVAYAARRHGIAATIVVPHGNSPEKNRSMRALGAELIEHGDDFQAALLHSRQLASERHLHWIPSFHRDLVVGNATASLDFLRRAPALDVVYVSIGMGSGVCAMAAARNALRLPLRIIGVASAQAPAIAHSFAAGTVRPHPVSTRIADGMACSTPDPDALALIRENAERIVCVDDDGVEAAMRWYFSATHNVAEGAAAAALAGVVSESSALVGKRVGIVCTGANVDADVFARVLADAGAGN